MNSLFAHEVTVGREIHLLVVLLMLLGKGKEGCDVLIVSKELSEVIWLAVLDSGTIS